MKTLVISGISRGIGRATAEHFLQEGWRVIGTTTRGLPYVHESLTAVPLDFTDENSVKAGVAQIRTISDSVNVLINNAGIHLFNEDETGDVLTVDTLQRVLAVNLVGAVAFTEPLLDKILQGGHIISVSSGWGIMCEQRVDQSAPAYSISKAALGMYMKTLAARLKWKEVTVSALDPGWVRTEMGGMEAPRDPKEPAEELFRLATSVVPSGRMWHRGKETSW